MEQPCICDFFSFVVMTSKTHVTSHNLNKGAFRLFDILCINGKFIFYFPKWDFHFVNETITILTNDETLKQEARKGIFFKQKKYESPLMFAPQNENIISNFPSVTVLKIPRTINQ